MADAYSHRQMAELRSFSRAFTPAARRRMSMDNALARRSLTGGTARANVEKRINEWEVLLERRKKKGKR